MTGCNLCANGCGGSRSDCPVAEWEPPASPTGGAHSTYSRAVADEICHLLADGQTLRSIARREGMPTRQTIRSWIVKDYDGFAAKYETAYRLGLDEMADQILDISDDGTRDYKMVDGREVVDSDHIQRSRLRVDSRKWLLARRLPKEFGDKVQHTDASGTGNMVLEILTGVPRDDDQKAD